MIHPPLNRGTATGQTNGHGRWLAAAGVAAASVVALLLAIPSVASAQLPAICEQYPELPVCQEEVVVPPDPDFPEPREFEEVADVVTPVARPPGPRPGPRKLPFTGYPLTPLLLLLLLLLLAGLAIRAAIAIHDRRSSATGPASPDPPLGTA